MEFASGAEAVAYYYSKGFFYRAEDISRLDYRIMYNPDTNQAVEIEHKGFLSWVAAEIQNFY